MNSNQLQEDEQVDESRPYKCPNPGCRQSYATEKSWNEHVRKECEKRPTLFKCPYCPYNTLRSFVVRRHIKTEHKGLKVFDFQIKATGKALKENPSGVSDFDKFRYSAEL